MSALPPPLVPLFRDGDTAGRHLDVELPPGRVVHATEGDELHLCPDNVWPGRPPYTLRADAQRIVGRPVWTFWWD